MTLEAIGTGKVALVTGGASGIGLAAARHFAAHGMSLVVVDVRAELFDGVAADLRNAGAANALCRRVDVSSATELSALEAEVASQFGALDVLMCNAGIGRSSDCLSSENWEAMIDANMWGIIRCCQAFVPPMLARGTAGLVINTGSKQGITAPPGNPGYNVSKAGVKVYTEALQHQLRESGANVSAHLLVPGFVFTDMIRSRIPDKPPSAWTPEQTVAFMFERLEAGDFYVLCPDNDVSREMDNKRIAWAAGDLVENRPPLSRWHPDWKNAFAEYMAAD